MTHSAPHQANITAKAERAVAAIDSLIWTRLIADTELPSVVDIPTGRAFMLDMLTADPELAAPWWVAIGIEHDRLRGHYAYGPGERAQRPTHFDTSRQTVLDLLDARVWADAQPATDDPFAGLTGEAF